MNAIDFMFIWVGYTYFSNFKVLVFEVLLKLHM